MNKKMAIIGAGGHGKVAGEIALLNKFKVIDFFDDRANQIQGYPFTVVGTLDYLLENIKNYNTFFVAIGDNKIRRDKINWLKENQIHISNLVHPKSTISEFATIGMGVCIMANAVINPGTLIKAGVSVNTSASIDHDCLI